MHVIRHPVTFGSRVPEWPVFSTLRIFLIHATTSCEEGLEGLSKLMTPYFLSTSIGLLVGEYPHGSGVKCDVLILSLSKFYTNEQRLIDISKHKGVAKDLNALPRRYFGRNFVSSQGTLLTNYVKKIDIEVPQLTCSGRKRDVKAHVTESSVYTSLANRMLVVSD